MNTICSWVPVAESSLPQRLNLLGAALRKRRCDPSHQPPATSHNNCEQSTAALFAVFDPFVAGKFRWFDSAVIGKLHRVFIDVHKNIVQRKHGLKVVFRINKLDRADTIRLGVEK